MNNEQRGAWTGGRMARNCAARFFLAALLSGSRMFGGCTPFGLGFVAAAGTGGEGLCALIGVIIGSMLFLPFIEAMKYIAAAILIFSVSVAFYDTNLYRKNAFLPLTTGACTAAAGFVYLSRTGAMSMTGVYFFLEILFSALCAIAYRTVLTRERIFPLPEAQDGRNRVLWSYFVLCITVLIALANLPLAGQFSVGRILAVTLVLVTGRLGGASMGCAAGLCAGLAMDTVTGSLYFSVSYAISALMAGLRNGGRVLYTALYLSGTMLSLLWTGVGTASFALPEALIASVLFLAIPGKLFRSRNRSERTGLSARLEAQLRATAAVFRDLYDALTRSSEPPEEEEQLASVFDRAADSVCRTCTRCSVCWEKDYITTYNALRGAAQPLNERGRLLPSDFGGLFTAHCGRLNEFTAAVNTEFNAFLLRRQYRSQLNGTRKSAKEQYARVSELLNASADSLHGDVAASAAVRIAPKCEVSSAVRPKEGEKVSGDTVSAFRDENGTFYALLSDGMGCGESARRESAMAVRLLKQFLKAGIDPVTALRTLNTALTLHSDENGSFTTVDLMALNEEDGSASFYKYGAAPSYIKHGSSVRRVTGTVLPAGLVEIGQKPDMTTLRLSPGDFVLLISDGLAGSGDDAWIQDQLSRWESDSAPSLASALMEIGTQRSGRLDDRSLIVVRVPTAADAVQEI